jgi:hypothetical protein
VDERKRLELVIAGTCEGKSTKWREGEWLREWMRFEQGATEETERRAGGTDGSDVLSVLFERAILWVLEPSSFA